MKMNLYKPGTKVNIGLDEEDYAVGVIFAVCIEGSCENDCYIKYKVIWWEKSERKVEWITEHELQPKDENEEKLSIGFHSGS